MQSISQQIKTNFDQAKSVIIAGHQNPDGDSLGSMTALAEFFALNGKKTRLFSFSPIPEKMAFLPHSDKLEHDTGIFKDKNTDLVIILDSGDLKRAAVGEMDPDYEINIINIDHHITNENYGHLNLVAPSASSTAEVLFRFFREHNIAINHRMATSLLTGIISDTDNFSNSATHAGALSAASELLRYGGNLALVNNQILKNKTIGSLKLWGEVLSRINKQEEKNLVYTYVTREDFVKYNLQDEEVEGIANFLNNLEDADICLLLRETPDGKIRGSLRTTKDNVDVARIAKNLGGGGHTMAAGFTHAGTIQETLDLILKME